jgi:MinD superfamily P-loop ATPase
MIEVAKNSDYVILITEPTPFGLNDLILAVETLDLLNKSYSVVINRAGNKFKGVEEYCKENDISIIASIAEDRNIAKLYSVGQLLIENDANFLIAIELIYDFILELEQGK